VPRGAIKLEVSPLYLSWSSRFGIGGSEPLAVPLTDPTGALLFPGITSLESTLREWVGGSGYDAVLGASRAVVSAGRVRVPLRAEVGVLDRLTLGVMVPLVQNRTEVAFAFKADSASANLGVNPALRSAAEVLAFTDELRLAAEAAAERRGQLCAEAPASPECADADALARAGSQLLSGFVSSYSASPFYPLASSDVAQVLRGRVGAFSEGLRALGLEELSREPLFAAARLDEAGFAALLADPAAGFLVAPPGHRVGAWELGDVEVNAALELLRGELRDSGAAAPRFVYRLGAGALVRLGTGDLDDADVLLDLAGGDGQTDLEGRVFADLRGGRFGLWGDVRYGVQRPRTVVRRVGPSDLLLVPAVNRAAVEWRPGSYLEIELAPRYHFTPELSLTGGYRLHARGEDEFVREAGVPEPEDTAPLPSPSLYLDAALLEDGTGETLHEVGGGLLLSTLEAWQAGRASRPLELRFDVRWGVSGSGLFVPDGVRALVALRLYFRVWGD
jgi:hypothetical protein